MITHLRGNAMARVFDGFTIVSPLKRDISLPERMGVCRFGIISGGLIAGLLAGGLEGLGVGATTAGIIGTLGTGALAGGALGAIGGAIGGNPLKGLEIGAGAGLGLTGAGLALAPAAAPSLGGAVSATGTAAPSSIAAPAAAVGDLTGATAPLTPVTTAALPALSTGPSAVSSLAPSAVGVGQGAASGATSLASGAGPATGDLASTAQAAADFSTPEASIGSQGGFWSSAGDWLTTGGHAGEALSGVGLVGNLIMGNRNPPGYSTLRNIAGQEVGQGQKLQTYLNTGTLPPGIQQSIDTASDAAIASIRSTNAARGEQGSSAEAQDIAAVRAAAVTQGTQLALQLYNTGVSETQMGAELYQQLMQIAVQQDQGLANAFGNFVYAMAGGGGRPGTYTLTPTA
jgi:hypothetical protein